jgi:hypothetical protein
MYDITQMNLRSLINNKLCNERPIFLPKKSF